MTRTKNCLSDEDKEESKLLLLTIFPFIKTKYYNKQLGIIMRKNIHLQSSNKSGQIGVGVGISTKMKSPLR